MNSRTLSKAMLLPLILAVASCAPDRLTTQPPSQAPGQIQGKPAVSSTGKIEIKALPSPCAWMNAPKDFKILSEDSFSIMAPAKTDLYNDADSGSHTATAPMLLFPAEDTFVLTTAVAVDFKQEYDGGFLVVYSDPDHWVKLLFEKSHYGTFSVCSNVTNVNPDDSVNTDVPGKEVFLRLTRAKDVFGFYYSIDGKKWAYIRYFRFPLKGPLHVGFASQSPAGEQCATVFSKIRYSPKAVGDFWTGEPKLE
jgi:regulation of enolase protein 1 (concanavalin A-like superfamily)